MDTEFVTVDGVKYIKVAGEAAAVTMTKEKAVSVLSAYLGLPLRDSEGVPLRDRPDTSVQTVRDAIYFALEALNGGSPVVPIKVEEVKSEEVKPVFAPPVTFVKK